MAKNLLLNPVSIYALGGLGEVGKNTYCIENDNSIIIIDAGVIFPDDDIKGINYVIPDYTHLKNNRSKIKALVITHGHEDHIGAIPFLIQTVIIPVIYAPKLAAALIKHKLEDNRITTKVKIVEYDENTNLTIGDFKLQFFSVTHSIPDSFGICVDTPHGRIVTTGDFKVDLTPISNKIDLTKIAKIGSEGVDLLMADSTNAEKEGYTPSERSVIDAINEIFKEAPRRLIISTFSSNISRIQQIVEGCITFKRKLLIIGRSMETAINVSRSFGYIKIPDSMIISQEKVRDLKPNELTILCTGSQGEPLAALSRIASGEHNFVKIAPGDTVVLSSSPIPGNSYSIEKVINKLVRLGADVITTSTIPNLHASGHPSKQELRIIQGLVHPKYFMPVHGEYRMLKLHADIAQSMGMPKENTFICNNGDVLILRNHTVTRSLTKVPVDDIYIDGKDVNGLSIAVIKDRLHLSNEGMVAVLIALDSKNNTLLAKPKFITKGFIHLDKQSKILFNDGENLIYKTLQSLLKNKVTFNDIKVTCKNTLSQYLYNHTHRNPMIIPLIMNKTTEIKK